MAQSKAKALDAKLVKLAVDTRQQGWREDNDYNKARLLGQADAYLEAAQLLRLEFNLV